MAPCEEVKDGMGPFGNRTATATKPEESSTRAWSEEEHALILSLFILLGQVVARVEFLLLLLRWNRVAFLRLCDHSTRVEVSSCFRPFLAALTAEGCLELLKLDVPAQMIDAFVSNAITLSLPRSDADKMCLELVAANKKMSGRSEEALLRLCHQVVAKAFVTKSPCASEKVHRIIAGTSAPFREEWGWALLGNPSASADRFVLTYLMNRPEESLLTMRYAAKTKLEFLEAREQIVTLERKVAGLESQLAEASASAGRVDRVHGLTPRTAELLVEAFDAGAAAEATPPVEPKDER